MNLYNIWDTVGEQWKGFYQATNDADALRAFHRINSPDRQDYELYQIANRWDENSPPGDFTDFNLKTLLIWRSPDIPDINAKDLDPTEEELNGNVSDN